MFVHCDTYNLSSLSSEFFSGSLSITLLQGYSDMADTKVSQAVSKLEEDGLSVASCRKFLKTYSRVLHPCHAHMLDVKYSLLNLLGNTPDSTLESLTGEFGGNGYALRINGKIYWDSIP